MCFLNAEKYTKQETIYLLQPVIIKLSDAESESNKCPNEMEVGSCSSFDWSDGNDTAFFFLFFFLIVLLFPNGNDRSDSVPNVLSLSSRNATTTGLLTGHFA